MKRFSFISSSLAKNFFLFLTSTLILTLFFSAQSCISPTAPSNNNLNLTVADVSCTEAWLNLTTNNITLPANILIKKNGNDFLNLTLTNKDTTIYDSTLSPNQAYTYQEFYSSGFINERSETVTAKTMDTTSNNLTWQTFTFGGGGGISTLYDVAIVNDTSIWAVGEIYMNDSTGKPDPNFYNAVHWNGKEWNLIPISVKLTYIGSSLITDQDPLKTVFTFGSGDVWFVSQAGGVTRLLNGNWTMLDIPFNQGPGAVNKMWGSNNNDIYFVGNEGRIIHYSNGGWQKIESGTNVKQLDAWGYSSNVWFCGWEDFKPTMLLKYNNKVLTTVINNPNNRLFSYNPNVVSGAIESIWTNNNNSLFLLTWYGLYRIENNNFSMPKNLWSGDPNNWGLVKVRGNNVNDIVAVGINGRIWHYNGVSWKFFNELTNNTDNLYSVAIKGNLIIAVGNRHLNGVENYGVIYIGHRN